MARIRTIGKKEAPVAKRHTIGQKFYSKLKSIGQKVVDSRYAVGSLIAAGVGASLFANSKPEPMPQFPSVPKGTNMYHLD